MPATVPRDERHLVVRSRAGGVRGARRRRRPGCGCTACNAVPHGRGLGSSSAAIVGGLVAGARAGRRRAPSGCRTAALFALAARIEGHPDNVAPAVLGGLTVAWRSLGRAVRGRAARGRPGAARGRLRARPTRSRPRWRAGCSRRRSRTRDAVRQRRARRAPRRGADRAGPARPADRCCSPATETGSTSSTGPRRCRTPPRSSTGCAPPASPPSSAGPVPPCSRSCAHRRRGGGRRRARPPGPAVAGLAGAAARGRPDGVPPCSV